MSRCKGYAPDTKRTILALLVDMLMVRRDARYVKFLYNGKACGVFAVGTGSGQILEARNSRIDYVSHYQVNKKMAEKKEGATMVCSACGATLTCMIREAEISKGEV